MTDESYACESPVLFLVFNRPDTTARSFGAIRAARPPRLYVSADGPRADRPEDQARCEAVRRIATTVDWPCTVKTRFRESNFGCRDAVVDGIDWFFAHEEQGIIVEDDIVLAPAGFRFFDQMLEEFAGEYGVTHVNSYNPLPEDSDSYRFSNLFHVWGWASWRRAWALYDSKMQSLPYLMRLNVLRDLFPKSHRYMYPVVHGTFSGAIDTWDLQWALTNHALHTRSIMPTANLSQNIGFGEEATHTNGGMLNEIEGVSSAWYAGSPPHDWTIDRALDDRTALLGNRPLSLLRRGYALLKWRRVARRILLDAERADA